MVSPTSGKALDPHGVIDVQAADHDDPPHQSPRPKLRSVDAQSVVERVTRVWDDDVLPTITDYIRIPNRSPAFDPQWAEHGHMARAVELISSWMKARPIAGIAGVGGAARGPHPGDPRRGPRDGRRHRRALRPPRQATRDDRLARRARPVGAGARGRPALRAGRRDDGYAAFAALTAIEAVQASGGAARSPRGDHRGERGVRQPRPARVHGRARRSHRRTRSRRVPRLGLPDVGPTVVDDIAARPHRAHAHRARARRGCALRRRRRRRAVDLPDPARAAVARRGRNHRRDPRARAARADAGRSREGAGGDLGRARRRHLRAVPVRRRRPSDDRRSDRAARREDVAADDGADRHRRRAVGRRWRQRAATVHDGTALVPAPADVRRASSRATRWCER